MLEHLRHLDERRASVSARDEARDADDYSVAAQIARHDVTHLQCTPSMARMLLAQDEARAALGSLENADGRRRGVPARAGGGAPGARPAARS